MNGWRLGLALALSACGSEQVASEPEHGLAIAVAPLELAGIGEARYRIEVATAGGPLWSEDVSSTQYGDGRGSIAYVGPCDGGETHSVTLTLLALEDEGGAVLASPADYRDPGPITRTGIVCAPNVDTPVAFDLTLLRSAAQGFFDVGVTFDDVFCSAKLDCVDALLHGPSGARGPTVVMGFACTSGQGTPTSLYLSDVTLRCVDADTGDGNVLATLERRLAPGWANADGNQGAAAPIVYQWARYTGDEELGELDKCFWNHAFGLDLAAIGARRCTLSARGTASPAPLPGGAIAGDVVWPVVSWDVEVLGPGGLCTAQPLDGLGSGVTSGYVRPRADGAAHPSFAATRTCGDVTAAVGAACDGDIDAVFRATHDGVGAAVAVTVGGVPAPVAYRLPTGARLDASCCNDACCEWGD